MFRSLVIYISLALFLTGLSTGAQTSLPGGAINKYSSVLSLTGPDRLTVDNPGIFSIGDTVLVIQMKGMEVSISNDNSYGAKQNTYSAGLFEFLIISSIGGSQLVFNANFENTYDEKGSLQVVRVPGYDNARVEGDLSCEPWDSAAGTGGVLVMMVGNTLTLNADIDVSGKGFKGAAPVVGDGICGYLDMSYDISSQQSGFKGEGAVSYGYLPPFNFKIKFGSGNAKGQGPAYNGGGGGNGKYSGGSGGGNIGSGGYGGSEAGECGVFPIIGIGGGYSAKPVWETGNRIFMGGGGGSGTQTGGLVATTGGNGGGIVIILADTLIGNGFSIRSNGESVTNLATAGGAGGGAGGSVLLAVRSYKNNLHIEGKGGDGGTTNGPVCTGSGGGGGGGLFWFSDPLPVGLVDTVMINGLGGAKLSSVDCNFSQFGSDGSSGMAKEGLQLPLTGFLFNSVFSAFTGQATDSICEGDIPAVMVGTTPMGGTPPYSFQWQSSPDNSVWANLAGETQKDYTPLNPLLSTTYYRRVVRDISIPPVVDVSKALTMYVQPKIENNNLSNYVDSVCSGVLPGTIFSVPVIPSGGNGTYEYVWEKSEDNGLSWVQVPMETGSSYTPEIRSVGSMTSVLYRRIVSSGLGCPDTSSLASLTYLPSLSNIIEKDQEICNGDLPSILTSVIPVGGGSGSYGYVWYQSDDGINYSTMPAEKNETMQPPVLVNGTAVTKFKYYQREITSSACKDTSDAVLINIYPSVADNTITKDTSICINTAPAELKGSLPSGGDGSYTYEWLQSTDDVTYNVILGETNPDYSPPVLGIPTYYKRKVNSNACIDISSASVFVNIHPVFDATIADLSLGQDTVCNGEMGQITLSLTSPENSPWNITIQDDQGSVNQNFTINSSPSNIDVDANYNSYSVSQGNGEVRYSLILVSDQWGCPAQNMLGVGSVVAMRPPEANAGLDKEVCGNISNTEADLKFGTGIWSGPAEVSFANPADPNSEIISTTHGAYLLAWTSSNGTCLDVTDETTMTFWEPPSKAVINPGRDTTLAAFATEIDLNAVISGSLVGEILWVSSTPGTVFSSPNGEFTTASQLDWGKNELKLKISNGSCPLEEDKIVVTVLEGLDIPKGISPRSSIGQNDYFKIKNIGNVDNELIIFTRSGVVVFKTENFMRDGNFPNGWDGTNMNGNPLPDDTYYYVIKVQGDQPRNYTGYVVIKGN